MIGGRNGEAGLARRLRRVRRAVPAALLAGLLAMAAPAVAGAAEPGRASSEPDYAYELADELMSPFCPGRALSECPSPQAADLREWIVEQDQAGVSRRAVEEELFRVWGDELRQTPRPEGVGLAAYAIPAVAFVAGGGLLAFFWRRQRRRADAEGGPAPVPLAPVDSELERTLDEELRRAESAETSAR